MPPTNRKAASRCGIHTGHVKRKNSHFKRNNQLWQRTTPDKKVMNTAERDGLEAMSSNYNLRNRPATTPDKQQVDNAEHVLVNLPLMVEMINTANKGHSEYNALCNNNSWSIGDVIKIGFGRKVSLRCQVCNYNSPIVKLYLEVKTGKRGPKSALLNVSVPTAILQSPIGVTPTRHLLLQSGLDPPAEKTMQKHVNRAGEMITNTAEQHMEETRSEVHGKIDVAHDTTYNNRIYTDNRPGQGGTIAVSATMDLKSTKVLYLSTDSKLCPHRQCQEELCKYRNVPEFQAIGREDVYARKSARELKRAGIQVQSFTSDGDSKAFLGFKEEFPQVAKFKCTEHLNRSVRRQINKHKFSKNMFSESIQKRRFAYEISSRADAEFKSAVLRYTNKQDLKTALQFAVAAIPGCYEGHHQLCDLHSLVCNEEKRWSKNYLSERLHEAIILSKEDKTTLKRILQTRLGFEAVGLTHKSFSTQGVEAFNKALTKSMPKNLTCRRNHRPRALSTVCRHNLGINKASQKLFTASTGYNLPSPATASLEKEEKRINYRKAYQQSRHAKYKRRLLKTDRFERHEEFIIQKKLNSEYSLNYRYLTLSLYFFLIYYLLK